MDFSRFRASGDLSDIVVVVEGRENHLHKFPLCAKSDYFCGLARSRGSMQSPAFNSNSLRVELSDFPGGQEAFSLVADFCYNMPLNICKTNAVQLRCAAQLLQMFGPGNLVEVADKVLQDIITSAKLSRSSAALVTLLLHCVNVGQLAATAGVVETCLDALVDTWLRSPSKISASGTSLASTAGSAFTPTKPPHTTLTPAFAASSSELAVEELSAKSLCILPEDWFAQLLRKAEKLGVKHSHLAELAVRYVSQAIDKEDMKERSGSSHTSPLLTKNDGDSPSSNRSTPSELAILSEKDTDTALEELGLSGVGLQMGSGERRVDLGSLLDKVLTILPEEAYNIPLVTMEWLTKVLRIATARGLSCRKFLVKIAADKLTQLSAEGLSLISPSVLHDIVLEARADDNQKERACHLIDTYLSEMARKGVLTADTFRLLATATPPDARHNHDSLYKVLEYILKNEEESLSDVQRQELLTTINLELVTEDTLQRALDSEVVPPSPVANAAVRLCKRLRSELDSVKYIAQLQEEELHKFQSQASPQNSPRTATVLNSRQSDSGFSDSRDSVKAIHPDATSEHVRAAQTVLTAVRSKLAMPLYTGHRPYLPSSSLSHGSNPLTSSIYSGSGSSVEHDISLQDELEFKFDRSFRSLDSRGVRSRQLSGMGLSFGHTSGAGHQHHRSTYFPYSQRY